MGSLIISPKPLLHLGRTPPGKLVSRKEMDVFGAMVAEMVERGILLHRQTFLFFAMSRFVAFRHQAVESKVEPLHGETHVRPVARRRQ